MNYSASVDVAHNQTLSYITPPPIPEGGEKSKNEQKHGKQNVNVVLSVSDYNSFLAMKKNQAQKQRDVLSYSDLVSDYKDSALNEPIGPPEGQNPKLLVKYPAHGAANSHRGSAFSSFPGKVNPLKRFEQTRAQEIRKEHL